MLKEGLEKSGDYEVMAVHTGTDALQSIIEQKQPFSLAIIDMGVRDIRPGTLVRAIREARSNMRIMLIPLFGQELPPSAQALNIQGVLPKPFFMGELPNLIEAAFATGSGQPTPLPKAPSPAAALSMVSEPEPEPFLDIFAEARPPAAPEPEPEPALDIFAEAVLSIGPAPEPEPEPLLDIFAEAGPSIASEPEAALDIFQEAEPAIVSVPEPEPEPAPVPEVKPPPTTRPEPTPAQPAPPPVEQPAAPAPPPFPYAGELRRKVKEVDGLLDDLNREVRAEAILVTSGGELIAFAGVLGRERSEELAAVVAEGAQATARVAGFLGEPDGRFEQSLHQGSEYTMFSLSPAEGLVLSMALSSTTPLGIIRYNALRTGKALLKLAGL
jgi:CheY-like chemotaxis protein